VQRLGRRRGQTAAFIPKKNMRKRGGPAPTSRMKGKSTSAASTTWAVEKGNQPDKRVYKSPNFCAVGEGECGGAQVSERGKGGEGWLRAASEAEGNQKRGNKKRCPASGENRSAESTKRIKAEA